MIYQPRNVTPTKKSVDIRVLDQYFTMEISTNSSVVAYKLFLLDWNNDTRYTGDIEYLDTPLYNGDTLYIEIPHPTLNNYDFIILAYGSYNLYDQFEGTDVSEFHQILVVTAWDKNDVTEFFVKDYWCEEFGPFYTGEDTYIKVDSPNLDTYLVRAYVKEGKNGDWQLVSESWNQEQVYLP